MTPGQRRAIQVHWPRYGLDVRESLQDVTAWFARPAPLVIEIGFGMGDSLAEMAERRRDMNFIGVEVHRPGVGHLLNLAVDAHLENLKVFNADSVDVLENCIPAAAADRIQIFFPDPWHKKRHHKRRLINAEFCTLIERCLKPGGLLHVATDWPPYADSIVEIVEAATAFKSAPPPTRPVTKFERRGLKLGHEVRDLAWARP